MEEERPNPGLHHGWTLVVIYKVKENIFSLLDLSRFPCSSLFPCSASPLRQHAGQIFPHFYPSSPLECLRSVRHTICPLEAPVTLKKLISVSLTVYLEVHHILCNSHGTFQKSVCCPCCCTVAPHSESAESPSEEEVTSAAAF